jgi:hypothetical protein
LSNNFIFPKPRPFAYLGPFIISKANKVNKEYSKNIFQTTISGDRLLSLWLFGRKMQMSLYTLMEQQQIQEAYCWKAENSDAEPGQLGGTSICLSYYISYSRKHLHLRVPAKTSKQRKDAGAGSGKS